MSEIITQKTGKIYNCTICGKIYQNGSGLRKHKKKTTSCIPVEKLNKLTIEKVITETRLEETVKKLLEENQKKESEIVRLRNLMENNLVKDVQDIKNNLVKDVQDIKDKITDVDNKIEMSTVTGSTAFNNCLINNNNQNNQNKSLKFSIKLAQKDKERFDHIPAEQMLYILDQEDFSHSIADLVQAVSFNPKAPENMTWCVNDKTAESGAIEYNSELNVLMKNSTASVISKNVQNILFPVTDILKEIEKTSTFNLQQNKNFARYFNMLGEETIKKEYINSIRERAYDKRGLCKALWDHLHIRLHTEKINQRTKCI